MLNMASLFLIMFENQSAPSVEENELQTGGPHERGWSRAIIHSLCRLLGSDNLVSLSMYASAEQDVLTCMVNVTEESILPLVSKLKNDDAVISTQWRVYEPLENATGVTTMSADGQHILVCNAMTPTVEREEDFNRWYDEEHILSLSKAPTWIQSSRYRLIDSNRHDAPSYLAMHKWGSRAAFESPEYVMATTTPWKFRVVDNVIARERHVYEYLGDIDVGVGGNGVEGDQNVNQNHSN